MVSVVRPFFRDVATAALCALLAAASACLETTPPEADTAPVALRFEAQPVTAASGSPIGAVRVRVVDANGELVTGATIAVTIAIATGPTGAVLAGTLVVTTAGGIATFENLQIDKSGTGYRLVVTAAGLTSATSDDFTVTAGAPVRLAFQVGPSPAAGGSIIAPPIEVAVTDAAGNVATAAIPVVQVTLTGGTSGATLSGTNAVASVAGVATFSNLSVDRSGSGYQLTASAPGLTPATSPAFTVAVGPPSRLRVTSQPQNVAVGQAIALSASVVDAGGNLVTSASSNVSASIASGTGASNATLGGTTTVAATGGVATFTNLTINRPANGYVLQVSATGLAVGSSSAFNVSPGAAAGLTFIAQPSVMQSGVAGTFTVAIVDAGGNSVAAENAVTLAVKPLTGAAGATLTGTLTRTAVEGVATFTELTLDKAGTSYRLVATSTGLPSAESTPFDVVAGAPAALAFVSVPSAMSVGGTGSVQVRIADAHGNATAVASKPVTLSLSPGSGAAGAVLGGTLTVNSVAGLATFSDLTIDRAATGYRLVASSPDLASGTSAAFDVSGAAEVTFTTVPTTAEAGASLGSVVVTLRDGFGAVAATSSASVSLALASGPLGATLQGTTTVAAVNGVATFNDVSIRKAGTGYRLAASATGFLAATSATFSVAPASATVLRFIQQPASMTSAQAATFEVAAFDAFDNQTAAEPSVTVAIASGTGAGGAVLGGTTTALAVSGVARFTDLTIDKAAAGYRLSASATGFTAALTDPFGVVAGAASRLAFTVQPSSNNANVALTPAVAVTILDAANNVTAATHLVTLAIASGTGDPSGTLTGTTSIAAVAGVATFPDVAVTVGGVGYRLTASAPGLTGALSDPFTIGTGVSVGLGGIIVAPASASVPVSGTVTLTATLRHADGSETVISPAWASSNPGRASVSAAGVVTGISAGTVTISATHLGLVGRATITITP